MIAKYKDSRGIPFELYRFQPPIGGKRPAEWPSIVRVKDPEVCRLMHERFPYCWECNSLNPQAHHIAAGSRGRSDELCAVAMLCGRCHGQERQTILPLGRVLYLKWRFDKCHTDWIRTALLLKEHLPDLVTR